MDVQRGLISLDDNNLSAETGLSVSVPVGKSFVISSVRADAYELVYPYTYGSTSGWQNPEYAYDNNTSTYSLTSGNNYLELLMSGTTICDSVLFRGKYTLSGGGLGTPNICVDTYYSSWSNIYSGEVSNDEWIEVEANREVDKIRVKFNNTFNPCESGYLAEVQLSDVQISTLSKTLCKVELTTISGGYFTKVKATRAEAISGCVAAIEWQAIYGDEFTVQSGTTACNDTLIAASAVISPVNISKSFMVHTNTTEQDIGTRSLFAATLTSGIVTFNRFAGESGDVNSINWYVVTWSGATVQNDVALLISDTVTTSIDTVDRSKAFLIYSYSSESESAPDALFSRGVISSDSEVTFATFQDFGNQYISFFVVEHPDLYVQYGTTTISGTSEIVTLSHLVNVNRTFLPLPQFGNSYSDIGIDGALHWCYNTQKLSQDGSNSKVTIERGSDEGSVYASWFSVGPHADLATLTTLSCSDITLTSFKAHGNITNLGNLPVTRRGFCYRKSMFGNPTVDDLVVYEDGDFSTGAYSLDITGLNPSTTTRLRAYAVNLMGVAYGSVVECTTNAIEMSEFLGTEIADIGYVNKFRTPTI